MGESSVPESTIQMEDSSPRSACLFPLFFFLNPLSGELRVTTLQVVWSPPAQRPLDRAG